MSTVVAVSGQIASGKSTLASQFASEEGWPYVSFGDFVRSIAKKDRIAETRENLQNIGDRLIREDLEGFCRGVLSQVDWRPGQPLVIDGVRHTEVSFLLRRMVAPSKYILTYVEVDDEIRKKRLREERQEESDFIERVETHPTEEQVKLVLPRIADYILDGTAPIHSLIEQLKAIAADEPPAEIDIPTSVVEVMNGIRRLTPAEQREVLARLWPEQAAWLGERVLKIVRFSDDLRIVAYAPEQERYLEGLRALLLQGTLACLENESDGTYEVFGSDRTYYVTMTPARQFAALLSSWTPESTPHEVSLQDAE